MPRLILYQTRWCGYCMYVRDAADRLGVELELRDASQREHRDALLRAMGRGTVPVLRIETAAGEIRWLPESRDIVRYLAELAEQA